MSEVLRLKAKVCLVGESGVGKTSLIRRYVEDDFSDSYLETVGTKVSKKELRVPHGPTGADVDVDMTVWDIMGQEDFRDVLLESYLTGAQGILAVADVTRPGTLDALYSWIDAIDRVSSRVPVLIAGNKADLAEKAAVGPAALAGIAQAIGADALLTSAKTGTNVEVAFRRLAMRIVTAQLELH